MLNLIEQDTIKLLRECDAGVKMGISSIDDVIESVYDPKLSSLLSNSKKDHEKIDEKIQKLLDEYHDDGKEPAKIAKGMSWIKTNVKMAMDESDQTIADLMTDGCNMGVKSLNKYLNKYEGADEKSKNITKDLIGIEKQLAEDICCFL